jgi:glycosyltransferase involved in cell wall biosynthesis
VTAETARDGATGTRQRVVMLTSSYPRFPGDTVGTFLEPIAHGVAGLGHEVHVVLPWHPRLSRPAREGDVHFHPFRYAPIASLNVFGYAAALRADVRLRLAAVAAAPLALAAAWHAARRVARQVRASVVHAHWVIPFGAVGAALARRYPLVISLHGSDVFIAERHAAIGVIARAAFRRSDWVTACSDDLRDRAIRVGAPAARSETVPYGVDADRFRPDVGARAHWRARLGIEASQPLVATAGRLVRKKGFEYLIDAMPRIAGRWPNAVLVVGGGGDLEDELRARAGACGAGDRVIFPGVMTQDEVAGLLAAADVVAVPSVRDDSGNVDGLPNVVMEALASGTPLVATGAGGIAAVVRHGENGMLVAERDPAALAEAIATLLANCAFGQRLGDTARCDVIAHHSWLHVARRFEACYLNAQRHSAGTADR